MYYSNTSKHRNGRRQVTKLVHLETYLGDSTQDSFYTGFSGRIQDGGVFLTTYRPVEQYAPVDVTIYFPDGQNILVRGTVEWIREANPAVPDMAPGIGITFIALQPAQSDLIESYLLTHPPMFLDSVQIAPPPDDDSDSVMTDDIELERLPINLGPGCDLDNEQIFVGGLARDIAHYLNERPMACLKKKIDQDNNKQVQEQSIWNLRIIPQRRHELFQGGFDAEDLPHRVFICTDSPSPVGASIHLRLVYRGGGKLGCMAEVKWVRKSNPLINNYMAPSGMGVVLKELTESTWRAINKGNGMMLMCEPIENF